MSLFVFGLGYTARAVVARGGFGPVSGTARTREPVKAWLGRGLEAFVFDDAVFDEGLPQALSRANVILVTAPPDGQGDPTLRMFSREITAAPTLERILYLSTVGVYGDAGGAWVDETSPTLAVTARARARTSAETAWLELGDKRGVPVDVLRLAGIYGPGRSPLAKARAGTARRVIKPGQVFNRIHVDDIAGAVTALVLHAGPSGIWNVADGAPAPPQDVVSYACELLGLNAPPEEPFETAAMSPMARSFYADNRRVSADKLAAIGWAPSYPTYREGLRSLLETSTEAQDETER